MNSNALILKERKKTLILYSLKVQFGYTGFFISEGRAKCISRFIMCTKASDWLCYLLRSLECLAIMEHITRYVSKNKDW